MKNVRNAVILTSIFVAFESAAVWLIHTETLFGVKQYDRRDLRTAIVSVVFCVWMFSNGVKLFSRDEHAWRSIGLVQMALSIAFGAVSLWLLYLELLEVPTVLF